MKSNLSPWVRYHDVCIHTMEVSYWIHDIYIGHSKAPGQSHDEIKRRSKYV